MVSDDGDNGNNFCEVIQLSYTSAIVLLQLVDVHPTKLFLLQESSVVQGEGVPSKVLEGGVDWGEDTRT